MADEQDFSLENELQLLIEEHDRLVVESQRILREIIRISERIKLLEKAATLN